MNNITPGQIISHYKIVRKLGEGGMGVVYLAEDFKLQRTVALKFLPPFFSNDQEAKKRFVNEAQTASALDHPNICTVYEIDETEDGQLFISMAYYEGETLREKLEKGIIETGEAIKIILQIAEGLSKAHRQEIVHRDIKSVNIFITADGVVKILDFGLAKSSGRTQLTQVGTTVGTCGYMSPEQARGEKVDRRTDIWSLGIIIYEMLAGAVPFNADYDQAVIYSILNENPDLEKIPEKLRSILQKAMAKDRELRYGKVEELIYDLEALRNNAGVGKHLLFKKYVMKKKVLSRKTIGILILAAALISLSVYYFFIEKNKNELKIPPVSEQQASGKSVAVMYFENIPDPSDKDHTAEMLTNLLITSLSQIKELDVISRERLLLIQKDLQQQAVKNLSPSYAEQVAHKANAMTMLIGTIVQEKPKLAVTTRLIDVGNGRIISSHQLTKFPVSNIFNLVDSLAYFLRNDLQITSASTSKVKPVSEVTTNSPEAYRAYVEGIDLFNKNYFGEAFGAFKRAVELDKNFAMAYSYLSFVTADPQRSAELFQKAVRLSAKATEPEQLMILGQNFMMRNESAKAVETFEKLINMYPHEIHAYELLAQVYKNRLLNPQKGAEVLELGIKNNPWAKHVLNNLVYFLTFLNRKQDALNLVNKYINMAPAEPNPYDTKGDVYAFFSRFDSSRAAYKNAFDLRGDFSADKLGMYDVLSMRYKEAEQYFGLSRNKIPLVDIHKGQLYKAINKINNESALYIADQEKLYNLIPLYYETGQYTEMLGAAKEYSLKLKKDPLNKFYGRNYIIWALLKDGKPEEAHSMLSGMEKNLAGIDPGFQVILDYTSGVVAFEEKNYVIALQKFQKVFSSIPPNHWPSIYFAVTLLKNGRISEAIELLRRLIYLPSLYGLSILIIPGNFEYWPIPAVKAHYWLGVAYERQNETQKALKEYEVFINIWKNADFNSPELSDAKNRVSKLKNPISQRIE